MLTVSEAIKRLEIECPDLRIVSGFETKNLYGFQMWGRDINPSSILEFPVGGAITCISKKDGTISHKRLLDIQDGVSHIDVGKYLNSEDRAFVTKLQRIRHARK